MNLGSMIYTAFIGPLKLLFEVVYSIAYYVTGSAGLSIIALSLAMNILLLPLYKRADAVQEEENEIQKKLKPGVDHIKKAFKGDEQYMILSTYYRQNHYKPIYALRSSISLLLQIPFFIAAYDFLSNEYTVISAGFGPIESLGSPDHLLFGLRLLPILMTVINIISSIIYTKGQPFKKNIQLYVMALAFLIFLYDRPAGLVLYWTLNNLFSLIKNIFAKVKNSSFILMILLSLTGVFGLIYIFVHSMTTVTMQLAAVILLLMLQIPVIGHFFFKGHTSLERLIPKKDDRLFYIEIIFLIIFYGLFAPCHIIETSPSEFVDIINPVNPLSYVLNTFLLAAGTFGIWFLIYYSLMHEKIKGIISFVLAFVCIVAVVDYLGFGRQLGNMSNMLIYDKGLEYSSSEKMINLFVALLILIAVALFMKFRKNMITSVLVIMMIASSILTIRNVMDIRKDVAGALVEIEKAKENTAKITLNKSGKNVVVIILDRAVNSFFPYILDEKPELKEKYSGFTYYPNTISYGGSTNFGIPAVYGGYEYTPEEMNRRSDELLMDKHNEAIKVMPVIFDENGYDVTIFDPCYANYMIPGDLSVYDEYPQFDLYNTEAGMFSYDPSLVRDNLNLLNRNLFCYSIMKSAPVVLQGILYNGGAYNSINRYQALFSHDELSGISSKAYVKQGFVNSFTVLQNMIDITKIEEGDSDNLLLMYNNSTHEPTLLQEPEYEMKTNVDNYEYDRSTGYKRETAQGDVLHFDNYDQISHYHINMASIKQLGEWFDYLKENDVYDNTRIIIVADHGASGLKQDAKMIKNDLDLLAYNPLLLMKDFDSKEFKVDKTFMTNADAIYLATKDLIDQPKNPFTGNRIDDQKKKEGMQKIYISNIISVKENNGKMFIYEDIIGVHDDIFDLNNWDFDAE